MLSTWVGTQYSSRISILYVFFFFFDKCMCGFLFAFFRENLLADCLQGCFVVTCTLCAFISLVWLREQIVHGGAPQWLEQHQPPPQNAAGQANEVRALVKTCLGNSFILLQTIYSSYSSPILTYPVFFFFFFLYIQAQAAGQGVAHEPPAAQPAPPDPPAQNDADPEPPDVPPDQADDPDLEEEEGAAAEDADANNGAQGGILITHCLRARFFIDHTCRGVLQLEECSRTDCSVVPGKRFSWTIFAVLLLFFSPKVSGNAASTL